MKAIILFVVTTAVWAEDLYVKNEGTPVIFGVGSDGDHIMVRSPGVLRSTSSSSQSPSGQTSQGQRLGQVFTSGQPSPGQRLGQVFTSGQPSPGQRLRQFLSRQSKPTRFLSQQTTLPQNRFCDHARRPIVDEVFQGRAYRFSWCHDGGRSYTWYDASHHCQRLGNGFQAVSIEHPNEDNFVAGVLRTYQVRDIWTSGSKLGSYQWYWETGVSTGYTNWSNTGRLGRSQPDNADGNEQCLAVVNSLGIGWHDSRCGTLRPVICETEAFYRK
ncbi:uncharacterized protein LOC121874822 [Homarus americanus]|uniref:uncharacterized protein LOC121874822 n=1 Tax=Homarus americanus TaxID=6706 RepID=UPI001C45108A|nr:uncharacterized protein LOC121874822 [Homarus americanus]